MMRRLSSRALASCSGVQWVRVLEGLMVRPLLPRGLLPWELARCSLLRVMVGLEWGLKRPRRLLQRAPRR